MEEKKRLQSAADKRSGEASLAHLDYEKLEENEPYLGPAWAVVMLILYLLKRTFPAEDYSLLWWIQTYVLTLVIAITVFTVVKRWQFYRAERARNEHNEHGSQAQEAQTK